MPKVMINTGQSKETNQDLSVAEFILVCRQARLRDVLPCLLSPLLLRTVAPDVEDRPRNVSKVLPRNGFVHRAVTDPDHLGLGA